MGFGLSSKVISMSFFRMEGVRVNTIDICIWGYTWGKVVVCGNDFVDYLSFARRDVTLSV